MSFQSEISETRFATYLKHTNNDENQAIELYIYNMNISASLMFPISILEVLLRNSISKRLENYFRTENWALGEEIKDFLMKKGKERLEIAIQTLRDEVAIVTTNDVISTLSFSFWKFLFHNFYSNFWEENFRHVFINVKNPWEYVQRDAYRDLQTINKLRNRIAHHEPIFEHDLEKEYNIIVDIINKISSSTWVHCKTASTFHQSFSLKPPIPKKFASDICQKNFSIIDHLSLLSDTFKTITDDIDYFIMKKDDSFIAVFPPSFLWRNITRYSSSQNFQIDFSDVMIGEIISGDAINSIRNIFKFDTVKETESSGNAKKLLRSKKLRFLLCRDMNNNIIGVIDKNRQLR
ncbi:MAG: hypothetical protein ABF665_03275 [Gluconacetobacter sp.]